MNSDLKREHFSSQIRQRQREEWRQQIRVKFMKQHQPFKFTPRLNKAQLIQLKRKCRSQNFSQISVLGLLSVLKTGVVAELAQDNIIKILSQILAQFQGSNYRFGWQHNAKDQIKDIIKNIIDLEINHQRKNEWTVQIGDLFILKNCFHFLIKAVCNIPQLSSFVNDLTSVQNKQMFRIVSREFITMIIVRSNENQQIPLQKFLISLSKISKFSEYLPYEDCEGILKFLTYVQNQYNFNNSDQKLIVTTIINILSTDIQRKMDYIIEETNLIQKLVALLEEKEISQSLQIDLIYLASKMFCAADEQINHIYQKCKNIIQILRDKLPVSFIPTNNYLSSAKKLTHYKNILTRNSLFALSNIIASGIQYAQICLSSDIFRALKVIYELSNSECRSQVIVCFYNMLSVFPYELVQIMIQQNFIDIICSILSEEEILDQAKGLQIILQIMQKLQDQGKQTLWNISRKQFQVLLIEKGIKTKVQGLIISESQNVSNLATKILESMSQQNTFL